MNNYKFKHIVSELDHDTKKLIILFSLVAIVAIAFWVIGIAIWVNILF